MDMSNEMWDRELTDEEIAALSTDPWMGLGYFMSRYSSPEEPDGE